MRASSTDSTSQPTEAPDSQLQTMALEHIGASTAVLLSLGAPDRGGEVSRQVGPSSALEYGFALDV